MLAAGLEGKAEVSVLWEGFSLCDCFVFLLILLLLLPIALSGCFLLCVVWCVDAFAAAAFAISGGRGGVVVMHMPVRYVAKPSWYL